MALSVSELFSEVNPCVFTLSTGRAGTTTLVRLFRNAPEALVWHEPLPHAREVLGVYSGAVSVRERLKAFWHNRTHLLSQSRKAGVGYAELGAHLTLFAYEIAEALPQAKFLHMVRDPRFFVRSAIRCQWYARGRIHAGMKPRHGEDAYDLWPLWGEFQRSAWYWMACNRWIRLFGKHIGRDRFLRFYAEDLFAGRRLDELAAFLGLSLPADAEVRHVLERPLNAEAPGDFTDVSNWTQTLHDELDRIIGDEVGHYRYAGGNGDGEEEVDFASRETSGSAS